MKYRFEIYDDANIMLGVFEADDADTAFQSAVDYAHELGSWNAPKLKVVSRYGIFYV